MTETLRTYLLSVTAVCLLTSLLMALVPSGSVKKTLSLLCGLAVILTAVGPVAKIDFSDMARSISRAEIETDEAESGITVDNRSLISAIIKEKTETYILDKAEGMGLQLAVSVEMEDGGDYPYPSAVELRGTFGSTQKTELSAQIESELAIPKARQEWISYGHE